MRRRGRGSELPSAGVSAAAMRRAADLSQLLLDGNELATGTVVPGWTPAAGELCHAYVHRGVLGATYGRPVNDIAIAPSTPTLSYGDVRRFPILTSVITLLGTPRQRSRRHQWMPLGAGRPFSAAVTSQHLLLRSAGWRPVPLAGISRLEPMARDLSVLDIDTDGSDLRRLRLWGEHVPYLTVLLGWLLWERVIAVPEPSTTPAPPDDGVVVN